MPFSTLLSIDDIDFGNYSARGLTMSLEPIAQAAALVRNMNGELMDISLPQFRKYQVSISCQDVDSPEFVPNVWPGKQVIVRCVPHLGTSVGIEDGSDSAPLSLIMRVVTWSVSREEWAAKTSWQLSLLEI